MATSMDALKDLASICTCVCGGGGGGEQPLNILYP